MSLSNAHPSLLSLSLAESFALSKRLAASNDSLTIQLNELTASSAASIEQLQKERDELENEKNSEKLKRETMESEILIWKEELRAEKEKAVENAKREMEERVKGLIVENGKLKEELGDLRVFREDKESVEKMMKAKEAQVEVLKLREKQLVDEMERKFLGDFDKQQV